MAELEYELRNYGRAASYPEAPDVWPAIAAAIEASPIRRRRRQAAFAFAFTFTAVAVAVALAFAIPPARSAILRLLGLDGVSIVRVDRLPPLARPRPSGLGRRTSLAEAQAAVPFPLRFANGDKPGAVYVGEDVPPAVVLVYGSASEPRLLLSEFQPCCRQDTISKEVPRGVPVKLTDVGGDRALWIEGRHLARAGMHARLAGNTLIWEHNAVLYRLEGHFSEDEARRLAARLRTS